MSDRREHVLVLAEINAAKRGFRNDLNTGVAQELGVPIEAYRSYRQVAAAIDQYAQRTVERSPQKPTDALDRAEPGKAERLIEQALDLYRRWRFSAGWDPVDAHVRQFLGGALTLKGQIEQQARPLQHEPEGRGGLGLEH